MSENKVAKKPISVKKYFPFILLFVLVVIFSIGNPRFFTIKNFLTIAQQMVVTLIAAYGMLYVIVEGSIDLSVGGIVLIITGGAQIMITDKRFIGLFNGSYLPSIPNNVIMVIIITVIMWYIYNNFAFSREVRAVGGAEKVATLAGIRVNKIKVQVFILCGALAGLAGCFQAARSYAATPTMGDGMEMDVIAAVVLGGTPMSGGIGSVLTTVLGALIMCILSNGMNIIGLSADVQKVVKGIILIFAVCMTVDRKRMGVIK